MSLADLVLEKRTGGGAVDPGPRYRSMTVIWCILLAFAGVGAVLS